MQVIFLIFLFILGACFGSFLCCQARRLHIKSASKKTAKFLSRRSVCLDCGHKLKWYDNLPILSWLFLKGKCRKCGKKIGLAEFLSESLLAIAFLALGTTIDVTSATPLAWAIFIMTLIFTSFLTFLAIYDGLYGELPTSILVVSIICAIAILCLKETNILLDSDFSLALIWQPLISAFILGGLYLTLYLISKGKWVGDGDWLLGLAIGIALFDPFLALVVLFLANFLACLIMFPSVKGKHRPHIHFGPFFVAAYIIATTLATFLQSML